MTCPYQKVPEKIMRICKEYEDSTDDIIKRIAKFHIDFENIHPFDEGNGRTGRLIMFAQAIKNDVKIYLDKIGYIFLLKKSIYVA